MERDPRYATLLKKMRLLASSRITCGKAINEMVRRAIDLMRFCTTCGATAETLLAI